MGRWSPATTTRARGNGFTFSACNSKRHRAEEPNGSAVTSARSSTLSPRRRGNVRVVVDNRNSEGVQGVLGRVQWLLSLGQAPRERARLSLRIFGLDGMLFEAPNLLFSGIRGFMAFRSGLFYSPHDHDAWNRLLWNRHGKVFGSGRSFGLILSIDSQLGSSTRLSCVYSYMHRVA